MKIEESVESIMRERGDELVRNALTQLVAQQVVVILLQDPEVVKRVSAKVKEIVDGF